jgi:hypothetical protein
MPPDDTKSRAPHGNTKHGFSGRREYTTWLKIRDRCTNPNSPDYPDYGGRGITVCDRWQASFEAFLVDFGPIPDGMSIDRIDVNGNYEPGNCRLATPTMQARNRRDNALITHEGVTLCLSEWAERTGLTYSTLRARHQRGFSPADILSTDRLTRRDLHRMKGRPTGARGERNVSAKLTEAIVRNVFSMHAAGMTQVAIAARVGVTQTTVSKILRHAIWKHVV